MSEVRFDNCLIEIDNVVYYGLPSKLVDYVKKLYENNKSYQRQIESLGDRLAENTNYWVRTTDERNKLQTQLQQKENIIKEVREKTKENQEYLESAKEMYLEQDDELLKIHTVQLINNNLSQNDDILEILDKENKE